MYSYYLLFVDCKMWLITFSIDGEYLFQWLKQLLIINYDAIKLQDVVKIHVHLLSLVHYCWPTHKFACIRHFLTNLVTYTKVCIVINQ